MSVSRSLFGRHARAGAIATASLVMMVALAAGSATATPGHATRARSQPLLLQSLHRVAMSGGDSVATVMHYGLPIDARQGPSLWYTLRLNLLVSVTRAAGHCIVSASTNNNAAAQIEVTTSRHGATIDALGWIDGHRMWRTAEAVVRIRFRNYLQVNGVRPGDNVLSVKAETLNGRCVRRVVVLPGTGVASTRARPDELLLFVPRQTISGSVGRNVTLPFRLERRGGRPDGPVTVALGSNSDFAVIGSSRLTFPRVGSGIEGSFVIVPKVRDISVLVYIPRRLNQPTASFFVQAGPSAPAWYQSQTLQFVLASTLIVGALLLVATARNQRRFKRERCLGAEHPGSSPT